VPRSKPQWIFKQIRDLDARELLELRALLREEGTEEPDSGVREPRNPTPQPPNLEAHLNFICGK
jgi:hypothetical protein